MKSTQSIDPLKNSEVTIARSEKTDEVKVKDEDRFLEVITFDEHLHSNVLKRADDVEFTNFEHKPQLTHASNLAPLNVETGVEELSLLSALREEPGIKNPNNIYKEACKHVKYLKEHGILDKYIVNDDEAATLCTVPNLLESGIDLNTAFESCAKKSPSKLVVLLLKSLRKLPQSKGTVYFGRASDEPIEKRAKGTIVLFPFIVGSYNMAKARDNLKESKFKEIFRVESCFGYDASDFVEREEAMTHCKEKKKKKKAYISNIT